MWHNRLGYRDPKAIQLLVKAQASNLKPFDKLKTSDCCIKARITRKPLPKKSESRAADTDVCRPMQTVTPGGTKYFMTMIDYHCRSCKVYLLKQKSKIADKVKDYVKYVQTKFRKTPKKIRSDRGGVYTVEELQKFLKNEGIQ